jgi:hypothetical protein
MRQTVIPEGMVSPLVGRRFKTSLFCSSRIIVIFVLYSRQNLLPKNLSQNGARSFSNK